MGLFSQKPRSVAARPTTLPEDEGRNASTASTPLKDLMGQGWRETSGQPPPPVEPTGGGEVQSQADTAVRWRGNRLDIRGRVRAISEVRDGESRIFQFRVDAYDSEGRRQSFPVELHGRRFIGLLSEGDLVQLSAKVRPGEPLRIRKLRNLTTQGAFQVRGATLREQIMLIAGIPGVIIYVILQIAFFVGFLWAIAAILAVIFRS